MTESQEPEEHSRLVRPIRKIAREEAIEAIDEHLYDYEHKEATDTDNCA
jgi:hypothetical protein